MEVAPTKADEFDNGVTTTLSGTPVRVSLPLILRTPSLITGLLVRNMEGGLLQVLWRHTQPKPCPCGDVKIVCFGDRNEEKGALSCRDPSDGGISAMVMVKSGVCVSIGFKVQIRRGGLTRTFVNLVDSQLIEED